MTTAILNATVFDGATTHRNTTVILSSSKITSISPSSTAVIPSNADTVDAKGCTLLPGLIDAHVHTRIEHLELALKFGVTTELEMMGYWPPERRKEVADRDDVADVRSAGFGLTPPGGHPEELKKLGAGGPPPGVGAGRGGPPSHAHGHSHGPPAGKGPGGKPPAVPTASTPDEAAEFVAARVAEGSDYIKIMIEEGSVLHSGGLPVPSQETISRAVTEAHAHGKIAIAHALTRDATAQAINAGMDGLAHLFLDGLPSDELVRQMKDSGAFVTPCICLNSSIMGHVPYSFADDERVSSRLSEQWQKTLRSSFNTYPQGDINHVLQSVRILHDAGVDILAGTDVSMPVPTLGGLAHGASVHHEMQLLVEAGLTPTEALMAATSVPARRFGLEDRGRIEVGLRADLLLVEGDPTVTISDSLNIRGIWRRGVKLVE